MISSSMRSKSEPHVLDLLGPLLGCGESSETVSDLKQHFSSATVEAIQLHPVFPRLRDQCRRIFICGHGVSSKHSFLCIQLDAWRPTHGPVKEQLGSPKIDFTREWVGNIITTSPLALRPSLI